MAESSIKKVADALRLPGETLREFQAQWSQLSDKEKAELRELASAA